MIIIIPIMGMRKVIINNFKEHLNVSYKIKNDTRKKMF